MMTRFMGIMFAIVLVSFSTLYVYERNRPLDDLIDYTGVITTDNWYTVDQNITYFSLSDGQGKEIKQIAWEDFAICPTEHGDIVIASAYSKGIHYTSPYGRMTPELVELFENGEYDQLRRLLRVDPNFSPWGIGSATDIPTETVNCTSQHKIIVTTPILGLDREFIIESNEFTFIVPIFSDQ